MARRNTPYTAQVSAPSQSSASDAEGDESQRVIALSLLLQTPKPNIKELQNFQAKVAADQQELKVLLEQRKTQAEEISMCRRNEFTGLIVNALQTPNRPVQGVSPTLVDTKIARNAVFKSVADVLKASEHLIGEYVKLDAMITGIRDAEPEGVAEAWTEDIEKTARLLKTGAEIAIRNVKRVLGADVEVDERDVRMEAGERMDGIEKMELKYELQKSLQYVEKGVKKMVKNLPQDEDLSTAFEMAATKT
ncbi:uncharacterized protein EKO05_0005810 [Ascochyta rabiei]|uniref:Uncharacterized protein n=1 Tax=Didymella rabiei TaxID=5454 RepID=A0A163LLL4_DIDRA|nr:uncharacterized protein EKO05_0005810 [Ascochyta rabiei]KZM27902.1 hypothetical protein ST47_g956 [Ascochyta rabiei]UPX15363.1 hypothetical protein EKO05_0005810 [Ascochyta rabiei]